MIESPRIITYCGFTDNRNIGDMALFLANRRLFPKYNLLGEGHDKSSDINLFGGGTHYPYALRRGSQGSIRRRQSNFAIGLGVHDPGGSRRFGLLTRWAMRRWSFNYLGVRGYRSQEICALNGVRAEVTGDTALFFERSQPPHRPQGLAAISVVGKPMGHERIGSREVVFNEMVDCCHTLIAMGMKLMLVPFSRDDVPWMERMSKELDSPPFLNFWTPDIDSNLDGFFAELEKCDLLIGERLHSVVLAAALGIPFISIAYKPKCFDFVNSIGLDRYLIKSNRAVSSEMIRLVRQLMAEESGIKEELKERVGFFRQRIKDSATNIQSFIESKT